MGLILYPTIAITAAEGQDVRSVGATPTAPTIGPATAGPAEEAPTARSLLEKRVIAKWDALIRKDFAAAYSFTSPEYRKLYSEKAFRANFGDKVNWQRVEIVGVDFKEDNAATVGVNIYFTYYDGISQKILDMRNYVQESWVCVDGQWWSLMKR